MSETAVQSVAAGVDDWLHRFEEALTQEDAAAARAMFHRDRAGH